MLIDPDGNEFEAIEWQGDAKTKHLAFVMIENLSLMAFASAVEPLRIANMLTRKKLYSWSTHSWNGKPVAASNGLETQSDGDLDSIPRNASVIVCTGVNVERQQFSDKFLGKLRYLASHGSPMGAICTGAFVLAKAGLLEGRQCTIHWESLNSFTEEFPEINVSSDLFEVDRERFTSAGGTAALDMMLSFVAEEHGQRLAAAIADMLIHHRIRTHDDLQRPNLRVRLGVSHPKLLAAVELMEANMEEPLSCSELAREVSLSPRQLERLFAKYVTSTPTRFYLRMRLNQARLLLAQTSMSVLTVAMASGFISASHFSKCYREEFDRTPSQERQGVV